MAGISSSAAGGMENRRKYNGIEYDSSLSVDIDEAYYRDLDPQTGRWWQIDPKCEASINPDVDDDDDETTPEGLESITPYASMNDNPAKHADPLGDLCCAVAEQMMQTTNMVEQRIIEAGGGSEDLVGDGVAFTWEVAGTLAAGVTAVFEWASEKVSPAPKVIPLTPSAPSQTTTQSPPGSVQATTQTAPPKAPASQQNVVNSTVTTVHKNSALSKAPSGNYTNTHKTGKTYSGVGLQQRAKQSASTITKRYNDPLVSSVWQSARNKKIAYKREHKAILKNGGAGNVQKNYNKNNSPGMNL